MNSGKLYEGWLKLLAEVLARSVGGEFFDSYATFWSLVPKRDGARATETLFDRMSGLFPKSNIMVALTFAVVLLFRCKPTDA